ncbi:hypothetical protein [Kineococcus sp. SYSU DK002]|uniref:hypothetical protein n=1 Tax=Kineococcus sp. SYSU DK002 TaxID=3383123 RepID=UPI003D7DD034
MSGLLVFALVVALVVASCIVLVACGAILNQPNTLPNFSRQEARSDARWRRANGIIVVLLNAVLAWWANRISVEAQTAADAVTNIPIAEWSNQDASPLSTAVAATLSYLVALLVVALAVAAILPSGGPRAIAHFVFLGLFGSGVAYELKDGAGIPLDDPNVVILCLVTAQFLILGLFSTFEAIWRLPHDGFSKESEVLQGIASTREAVDAWLGNPMDPARRQAALDAICVADQNWSLVRDDAVIPRNLKA